MSKTTGKRGFVPAQPAAAISALDFAHTLEALNRARAAGDVASASEDEEGISAAAEVIADLSDKLIGIPMSEPAAIAEKVVAYAWLHNAAGHLNEPAQQRHIAEHGNDAAKGLLAIYLDLTGRGVEVAAQRAAWDAVVNRFEQAVSDLQATQSSPPIGSDADWDAAFNVYSDAWQDVIDTPAPDAEATVYKLRTMINHGCEEEATDTPDSVPFLQRLLNERAQDSAFPYVRLLQDACRQAGVSHPVLGLERES